MLYILVFVFFFFFKEIYRPRVGFLEFGLIKKKKKTRKDRRNLTRNFSNLIVSYIYFPFNLA